MKIHTFLGLKLHKSNVEATIACVNTPVTFADCLAYIQYDFKIGSNYITWAQFSTDIQFKKIKNYLFIQLLTFDNLNLFYLVFYN